MLKTTCRKSLHLAGTPQHEGGGKCPNCTRQTSPPGGHSATPKVREIDGDELREDNFRNDKSTEGQHHSRAHSGRLQAKKQDEERGRAESNNRPAGEGDTRQTPTRSTPNSKGTESSSDEPTTYQHLEHLEENNADVPIVGVTTKHSGLQRCFRAYDPFPVYVCVACTLKLSRTFWARLSTRKRVRWATTSPLLCFVGTLSTLRGRPPVTGGPEMVCGIGVRVDEVLMLRIAARSRA